MLFGIRKNASPHYRRSRRTTPRADSETLPIVRSWTTNLQKKPVDEPRLRALIDEYLAGVPDGTVEVGSRPINRRADVYNNVADQLMVNEVLLDTALRLIEKSVATVTPKTPPSTRAMYLTTLGQVQYKNEKL